MRQKRHEEQALLSTVVHFSRLLHSRTHP